MKLSAKADTRCSWGSLHNLGQVTDISQNCMCIKTKYCIPLASMIHLYLKFRKKGLHITVRVKSFSDSDSLFDTISVEVLNPPEEYLGIVNSFGLISKCS
jgi:hypothetical protein